MREKLAKSGFRTAAHLAVAIAALLFPCRFLQAGGSSPVAIDSWGTDLEGKPFDGASLRGKVILLDFWAVWCSPCIKAMPELSRLQKDFKKNGLRVVGIAVYSGSAGDVRAFLTDKSAGYQVIVGHEDLVERFGVVGFPTYFLIDTKGRIYKQYVGELQNLYQTVAADILALQNKKEAAIQ